MLLQSYEGIYKWTDEFGNDPTDTKSHNERTNYVVTEVNKSNRSPYLLNFTPKLMRDLGKRNNKSLYAKQKDDYMFEDGSIPPMKAYIKSELDLMPVGRDFFNAYTVHNSKFVQNFIDTSTLQLFYIYPDCDAVREFFVVLPEVSKIMNENRAKIFVLFVEGKKKTAHGSLEAMRCDSVEERNFCIVVNRDEDPYQDVHKTVDENGGIQFEYLPRKEDDIAFLLDSCRLFKRSNHKKLSDFFSIKTPKQSYTLQLWHSEVNTPRLLLEPSSLFGPKFQQSIERPIIYGKNLSFSNHRSRLPWDTDNILNAGTAATFPTIKNKMVLQQKMNPDVRTDTAKAMYQAISQDIRSLLDGYVLKEVDTKTIGFNIFKPIKRTMGEVLDVLESNKLLSKKLKDLIIKAEKTKRYPANTYYDCLKELGYIDETNYPKVSQEWCHLVGHGEGGEESDKNLVCGSKYANTTQLAIEEGIRAARSTILKVLKASIGNFSVEVSANCFHPGKFLAKWIHYCIKLDHTPIFEHTFDGQLTHFDRNEFRILKQMTTRAILIALAGGNAWAEHVNVHPLDKGSDEKFLFVTDTEYDPAFEGLGYRSDYIDFLNDEGEMDLEDTPLPSSSGHQNTPSFFQQNSNAQPSSGQSNKSFFVQKFGEKKPSNTSLFKSFE